MTPWLSPYPHVYPQIHLFCDWLRAVWYYFGMANEEFRYSQIPQIRGVGRPKKFESVEEMEKAIEAYFNSCFAPKMERIKIKDPDGNEEWIDSPAKDKDDNQIYIQIKPFTVTGLAIALDTTRDVLLDYETKPENAEFSNTIKRAKQMIQEYAESYLFNGKNPTGAIFNLKNNWGWVDRRETDITSKNKQIQPGVLEAKAADILEKDEDDQSG